MTSDTRDSRGVVDPSAIIATLAAEAAARLKRCTTIEEYRAVLFLYLNRAYEAGLDTRLIVDHFAGTDGCALDQAGLGEATEAAILQAFDTLDPVVADTWRHS